MLPICRQSLDFTIYALRPSDAFPIANTPPRARGEVRLSSKHRDGLSVIGDLRQSGSLKALFPNVHDQGLQAVLVNTAGGITGGDHFSVEARAGAKTTLTLTTQAAERAYQTQSGQTGKIKTRLTVESGARLVWVPQETILFDGCALQRRLTMKMESSARLLFAEPVVFGRAAMGERLTHGLFRDRVELCRDGETFFLDATQLKGDIAQQLAKPAVANAAGAMVLLVYVAPDAGAQLAHLRTLLPETAGASVIGDDLLIMRALAADSYELRQFLVPILTHLTGDALPRPWMI